MQTVEKLVDDLLNDPDRNRRNRRIRGLKKAAENQVAGRTLLALCAEVGGPEFLEAIAGALDGPVNE